MGRCFCSVLFFSNKWISCKGRQDVHVFLVLFREFIRLFFNILLARFSNSLVNLSWSFPLFFLLRSHRFSKSTSFFESWWPSCLFVADGFFFQ
jgi:hypothetical protein